MAQTNILLETGTNELEIVEFFVNQDGYEAHYGLNVAKVVEIGRRQPVTAMLLAYSWPGNVRELGNFVERLTIANLSSGNCAPVWESIAPAGGAALQEGAPMREQVKRFERQCLEAGLAATGSIRAAARRLGISHATLLRKMREYGISVQN